MRVVALAFGVVAGLVASLILALGGLDADIALQGADDRQVALIRFGLFVIGNVGVFGAALVVATPLIGAILLSLGAAAWIGAALLLHHGPDPVMITPPALLILAALVAVFAHLRSIPRDYVSRGEQAGAAAPEPADFDTLPPVPVAAGFYGSDGVTAGGPVEPAVDASLDGVNPAEPMGRDEGWNPRKKKKPPPRQEPMFLPAEGDEDLEERETLFARIARSAASFLSFGLYAGLAGAAVLVFWNLRATDGTHPSVATAEIPAVSVSSSAPASASSSSALPPPSSSVQLPAPPASSTPSVSSSSLPPPSSSAEPARVVRPIGIIEQPQPETSLPASASEPPPSSSEPPPSSSEEPAQAETAAGDSTAPQPFTMTPRMAAERAKPRPTTTTTQQPQPLGLTGL